MGPVERVRWVPVRRPRTRHGGAAGRKRVGTAERECGVRAGSNRNGGAVSGSGGGRRSPAPGRIERRRGLTASLRLRGMRRRRGCNDSAGSAAHLRAEQPILHLPVKRGRPRHQPEQPAEPAVKEVRRPGRRLRRDREFGSPAGRLRLRASRPARKPSISAANQTATRRSCVKTRRLTGEAGRSSHAVAIAAHSPSTMRARLSRPTQLWVEGLCGTFHVIVAYIVGLVKPRGIACDIRRSECPCLGLLARDASCGMPDDARRVPRGGPFRRLRVPWPLLRSDP